jgi:polyphosphate kinase 2 (PPK2 family)
LDAGGKDGTVKHVFTAFNPQGTSVVSFKQPTPIELDHDFLWRVHPHAPPKGWVAIFNAQDGRSYMMAGLWHNNAMVTEVATMDAAMGHANGSPFFTYHHHCRIGVNISAAASTA